MTNGRKWLWATPSRSRDFVVRPRGPPRTRPTAMQACCRGYSFPSLCRSLRLLLGVPRASAPAAVGRDTPVELSGYGSRPAPFQELVRASGKQRDLANLLWVAYFNEFFQAASNRNRVLLAEGSTAGVSFCRASRVFCSSVSPQRLCGPRSRLRSGFCRSLLNPGLTPVGVAKLWCCRAMNAAT